MEPLKTLNMIQLTLRDGALTLQKPMQNQEQGLPHAEFMALIRNLLETEKAEKLIFMPLGAEQRMRAELTDTGFKWTEKSEYGIQDYVFTFETQTFLFNQKPADKSFVPGFTKKLEKLVRDIQTNAMRILKKPKG